MAEMFFFSRRTMKKFWWPTDGTKSGSERSLSESRGEGAAGYKTAERENRPQIPLCFHVVSIPIHSWALFNACNTSDNISLGGR